VTIVSEDSHCSRVIEPSRCRRESTIVIVTVVFVVVFAIPRFVILRPIIIVLAFETIITATVIIFIHWMILVNLLRIGVSRFWVHHWHVFVLEAG
jgi:hypothetical protein